MKDMPANLKPQEQAKWLFKSVKTPEQLEDLIIHRVQQRVAQAESSIRIGVSFAAPMAFAIVGIIANRMAWLSYLEEEESMRHVQTETLRRCGMPASWSSAGTGRSVSR